MAQQDLVRAAARWLHKAHHDGESFQALPADLRPAGIDHAYSIQEAFHRLLTVERGPVAGYKIALTTPVMQQMVGFNAPCFGVVFNGLVHHSPATVAASDFGRLGAECEIAVRLSADLPASAAPYDRAGAGAAVGSLMAAFELVDDRSADYADIHFFSLVADNAWNAGVVLGPEITDWRALDLGESSGAMSINGDEVGQGYGRDVLGHPLDALAWLANELAVRGKSLSAGMIVMTGSIVTTKFLNPGDTALYAFDGLGEISLTVS